MRSESRLTSTGWGTYDEDLMRHTVDWLQKQQGPTFTTLFTISNHHPWIVPEHHQPPVFDLPLNSFLQRFLQTVHYTDYSLGLLVDLLKAKGLSKNTVLVIVGDHGQPTRAASRGTFTILGFSTKKMYAFLFSFLPKEGSNSLKPLRRSAAMSIFFRPSWIFCSLKVITMAAAFL